MPSCLVKSCRRSWRARDDDVALHGFPRDPERIRRWLECINIPAEEIEILVDKIFVNKKSTYRICSKHFTNASYEPRGFNHYLKKDAIPTLQLHFSSDTAEDDNIFKQNYDTNTAKQVAEASQKVQLIQQSQAVPVMQVTETSRPTPLIRRPQVVSQISPTTFILASPVLSIPTSSPTVLMASSLNKVLVETTQPSSTSVGGLFASNIELHQQISAPPRKRKRKATTERDGFDLPEQYNLTKVDKSLQRRTKKVQVKILGRSVGVQFNGAKLPLLEKFSITHHNRSETEQRQINQPDVIDHSSTQIDVGGVNLPKGKSSIATSMITPILQNPTERSTIMSRTISSLETEPLNERYKLTIEAEEVSVNPEVVDNSFIGMPEVDNAARSAREKKFIVYESCLNALLFLCRCTASESCDGKIVKIKKHQIGTAVSVSALCSNNHRFQLWSSQPFVGNMPAGNLIVSSGISLCGSNFSKIQSFFNAVGLQFISKSTHYDNQRTFLFPAVDYFWKKQREELIDELQGKAVALAGDRQCNSRGHSAKYRTYCFLDCSSKKILDFEVEQLVPGIHPISLEKKACKMALERLRQENVNIRVLCTDRHVEIQKEMQMKYSDIQHQFDVWHVANSIGKKLKQASKLKNCEKISAWITPAKNHLWWAASTCHGSPKLLKEKWLSICPHVANEHQWGEGLYYKACHHPTIDCKRQWLEKETEAHYRFTEVVADKKLLKDLEHLSYFCHTGELEEFHSTSLKYQLKGHRYFIDEMVTRTQLSLLDYNHNIGTLHAVSKRLSTYSNREGASRNCYRHGKAKKDWIASKTYESASQDFKRDLLELIFSLAKGETSVDWTPRCSQVPVTKTSIPRPERSKN